MALDRTAELRAAAAVHARQHPPAGPSKPPSAAAKAILRPVVQRSPFTKAALGVREHIRTLQAFLASVRRDYTLPGAASDRARDAIERDVLDYVQACQQSLAALKEGIPDANAHVVAHRTGIVLILSQALAAATGRFDAAREARCRQAARERRLAPEPPPDRAQGSAGASTSGGRALGLPGAAFASGGGGVGGGDGGGGGSRTAQQQALDLENLALAGELAALVDAARRTERTVEQVASASRLLTRLVAQQAEQIEQLYEQAVEATYHIASGNAEVATALQRGADGRLYVFVLLLVLALGLLFLDWQAG